MSIDQLSLINRCLGFVLIALYLALGFFIVFDLLPGSTIAGLLTGSNMQFASKDFWPVSVASGPGPYAPKLLLNVPEPGGIAVVGLAALAGVRRRRTVRPVTN